MNKENTVKNPNIVFFFADDQRFDTIAALGNKEISTPNLDELVHHGVSFTHAHIPGGTVGAVCMPSRAMVNSSRGLFHLKDNGSYIPKTDALLGEELQRAGYVTCGIGKWHNGTDSYRRSFSCGGEIFFGGMWDHWNVPANNFDPTGEYAQSINVTLNFMLNNKAMPTKADHVNNGKHSTDVFCDEAIKQLENWTSGKNKNKPFYLYEAFMAPHDPRTMPKKFHDMYKPENITLPDNYMENPLFKIGVEDIRDEILAPYPRTKDEIRRHIAEYYGMISHLDNAIGKIIQKVKDLGEYNNTIFVFAGDNGLALGQHGRMGKQNAYEHSVRVPLIFAGPGIEKNSIREEPCFLMDIFPTLCDMIDIPIPKTVEGRSLKTALQRNVLENKREVLYFVYGDLVRAVQIDNMKLISYAQASGKRFQLFDENSDPLELNDLYKDEKYKEVVEKLKKELIKQSRNQDDIKMDVSKKFWTYYKESKEII